MKILLLRASIVDGAHLSFEGRQLVRAVGNKIKELGEGETIDRLVSAPLPAAVQTAEIFASHVDFMSVVEINPSLADPVPPKIVVPALLERGSSVVVVGDEPYLASLGAFLIGRPTFPQLHHAQISCVENRQPAWCLRSGEIGKKQLIVA